MRSLARYAVANTVVRSRLSGLLKAAQYEALTRASREEAWNLLLGTPFGEKLPAWSGQNIYEIEAVLHNASASYFQGVVHALSGYTGEAGRHLLSRWDLDLLEYALRLWHGKEGDAGVISGYRRFVNTFPTEAVVSAETLEDLVQVLNRTAYVEVIERAKPLYSQRHSLFYLENALEKDFYQRLLSRVVSLGGSDGGEARVMVDAEIDLVNLSTVARLLNYTRIPAEEFPEYLFPGGTVISKGLLRLEKRGTTVMDLLAQAMAGSGAGAVEASTPLEGIDALEKMLEEMLRNEARRALAGYPFSFKAVMAFYTLTKSERRQLRSVFAAKRPGAEDGVQLSASA